MPRTKSTVRDDFASMEAAWVQGGEAAVTAQAIRKYAQVIDVTESGRDMKPLISGMFDAIDRLKALDASSGSSGSDYTAIIAEAEKVLADA